MLDSGFTKKINYLENNVREFSNIADGQQDFDVRNCNSLYFHGVLNSRITGSFHKLPSNNLKT